VIFREAVRADSLKHWQLIDGGLAASVMIAKAVVFDSRLTNVTTLYWDPETVRDVT
jgi:hypothetical protein